MNYHHSIIISKTWWVSGCHTEAEWKAQKKKIGRSEQTLTGSELICRRKWSARVRIVFLYSRQREQFSCHDRKKCPGFNRRWMLEPTVENHGKTRNKNESGNNQDTLINKWYVVSLAVIVVFWDATTLIPEGKQKKKKGKNVFICLNDTLCFQQEKRFNG